MTPLANQQPDKKHTLLCTNMRLSALNRDEVSLLRYYRSLDKSDREAVRCLLYAVKEIRSAKTQIS